MRNVKIIKKPLPQVSPTPPEEEDDNAEIEKRKEYGASAKKPMQELKESLGRDKDYYLNKEDPLDQLIVHSSSAAERERQRAVQPPPSPKPAKKKRGKHWKVTKYLTDRDVSILEVLPAEIIVQILEVFYTDYEIMKALPSLKKKSKPPKNGHYIYNPIECLQHFSLVSTKACAAATRIMFRDLSLRSMHARGEDQPIDDYIASIDRPRILSSGRKISLRLLCYRCVTKHKKTLYHDLWEFLRKVSVVINVMSSNISHFSFDFNCTCNHALTVPEEQAVTILRRENGIALLFAILNSFDLPRCEELLVEIHQHKDSPDLKELENSTATFWTNVKRIKSKDMKIHIDFPTALELQILADMANTETLRLDQIHHRCPRRTENIEHTILQLTPSNSGSAMKFLAINNLQVSSQDLVNLIDTLSSLRQLEITKTRMMRRPYSWIPFFKNISERAWDSLKMDDLSIKTDDLFWMMGEWRDTRKLTEAEQKAMIEMFIKVEETAIANGAVTGGYFYEVYVFWSERTRADAERTRLTGFGGVFQL